MTKENNIKIVGEHNFNKVMDIMQRNKLNNVKK